MYVCVYIWIRPLICLCPLHGSVRPYFHTRSDTLPVLRSHPSYDKSRKGLCRHSGHSLLGPYSCPSPRHSPPSVLAVVLRTPPAGPSSTHSVPYFLQSFPRPRCPTSRNSGAVLRTSKRTSTVSFERSTQLSSGVIFTESPSVLLTYRPHPLFSVFGPFPDVPVTSASYCDGSRPSSTPSVSFYSL